MDPKEIKELIELISRSDFASFELERDDFKLKLVKQPNGVQQIAPAAPAVAQPQSSSPAPAVAPEAPAAAASEVALDGDLIPINSPIVGTFYSSPSPDTAPFVEIGTKLSKGQVVCIVEAMKVMNEIESEIDAEIVDIFVANGQPVEYGEVLFHVRPLH